MGELFIFLELCKISEDFLIFSDIFPANSRVHKTNSNLQKERKKDIKTPYKFSKSQKIENFFKIIS